MSIATVILIVAGLLIAYYVAMVSYDLYSAKMAKLNSDAQQEELIDVSDQLDQFVSQDVNSPDEDMVRKQNFLSFVCKGLSPQKMSQLMEDAAEGTPNADLRNILFKCNQSLLTE